MLNKMAVAHGISSSTGTSWRKIKRPTDWAKDHSNDLETKLKPSRGGKSVEVLTCQYCSIEIDVLTSGKKPWDRGHEQLSTEHQKTIEKRVQAGRLVWKWSTTENSAG